MEQKKPTKAELERRINNAIVFVPKDKEYQCIYFADKGLKLEITQDHTIISTNYHKHIFDNITSSGVSTPYIYTKKFIDIALENDCHVKNEYGEVIGYSYHKLIDELKKKDGGKTNDYAIAFYCDMWFYNLFMPLYSIGNTTPASFSVYFDYIYHVAKNAILLGEHDDGLTTKQFASKVISKFIEITDELNDSVIFEKETDEQRIEKEIKSLQEKDFEEQV